MESSKHFRLGCVLPAKAGTPCGAAEPRCESSWSAPFVRLELRYDRNRTGHPQVAGRFGKRRAIDADDQPQAEPDAAVCSHRRTDAGLATRRRSDAAALLAQEELPEGAALPRGTGGGKSGRQL